MARTNQWRDIGAWSAEKNAGAVALEDRQPRLAPLAERFSCASMCSECLSTDGCVCTCTGCGLVGWAVSKGMCSDCRDAEPCDTCGEHQHSGPCHDETPEAVMYGVRGMVA